MHPVGQALPGQPEGIALNNQVLVKRIDLGITTRVYDQLITDGSDMDIPDAQWSIQVNIA